MFGKSNAWNGAGQSCDICGKDGEMQIDCVDEEGYKTSAIYCLECLRLVVNCDFESLQEKQEEY